MICGTALLLGLCITSKIPELVHRHLVRRRSPPLHQRRCATGELWPRPSGTEVVTLLLFLLVRTVVVKLRFWNWLPMSRFLRIWASLSLQSTHLLAVLKPACPRQIKRNAECGCARDTLVDLANVVSNDQPKLILADELEAITELVQARIIVECCEPHSSNRFERCCHAPLLPSLMHMEAMICASMGLRPMVSMNISN